MKQPLVLFTGSTYWNHGDDFVREGCRAIIADAFDVPPVVLSSLFFPFNMARENNSPLREPLNFVDLSTKPPKCDLIVVPGLACGHELVDFHRWVDKWGVEGKTIYLGGMWENEYAATHSDLDQPAYGNLKNSPLIVSRTRQVPSSIKNFPKLHTLACPSLLSGFATPSRADRYMVVSIQLPQELGGITNHKVSRETFDAAMETLRGLDALSEVLKFKVIIACHHESEVRYFQDKRDHVFFSPWFQDYRSLYTHCNVVFATRLHACFYANALGRDAVCCNMAERPTHAIKENPFTAQIARADAAIFTPYFQGGEDASRSRIASFQCQLAHDYRALVKPVVEKLL